MRIIKSFVTAAVFLLALESLTSAEMTVMSLQERMRRSDVVAIGDILESRNTGVIEETGVERWMAICRLKQIFKENFTQKLQKIPSDGFNIHISFIQIPTRTPLPLKLTEGKKYLLFLKETGSQGKGQIVYGMITDLHGAFEAGQDYFVHDENDPQYPGGVKVSFEDIVQRVSPSDESFVDIRDEVNRLLSEDELRMKERLIALSRGEGAVADLKAELMDGGMLRHRGDTIANGKIVSQIWDLAVPPKSEERAVTDREIRQLLRTLIEHQYWTFQGTQFVPDAPGFMFRFHYKDLPPIEYRCETREYEPSAQLSAIRSVWLSFVSGASPQDPVFSPKGEQVKATQPLTLTIQTAKEVYEQGESINIEASIKNSANDTAKIYSPAYWGVSEITVTNSKGVAMKPCGVKVERASFEPFLTIPPQSSVAHTFDSLTWFHCGGVWQFADDARLPPDTYKIYVAIAGMPKCAGARYQETSLKGTLVSDTITIEVRDQGKPGLPALLDMEAFPEQYRDAARAVAASVAGAGEDPKEFYAQVEPKDSSRLLVFHLWHRSAFEPQNIGMLGNPGGKCRDVWYDMDSRKATKTLFWQ
ncbi:MAG TPA: hypothetical protein DE315_06275 [Candidatus Omnitrophica bacterium]|nr:hypothetical protein [Candidatus Omnitrophota bacterium]HCI45116.1 hypothetical protein [Candidatus Omnitrophota bacterium]